MGQVIFSLMWTRLFFRGLLAMALCLATPQAWSKTSAPDPPDLRLLYRAKHAPLNVADVWMRPKTQLGQRAFEALGAQTPPSGEGWASVRLDAAALSVALRMPDHLAVEPALAHAPQGRISRQRVGIDEMLKVGAPRGRRQGRGVLVGLVDTGIDLTHRAFTNEDRTSRVVAVWDQDHSNGTPPAAFGYGSLCDAAQIARGACELDDPIGHGTHVASIAAGRHEEAGGVAPAADIAMVRSRTFTRLADAVRFLMDLGAARGQPTVVNISVGGHYGPHDGQTPLEQELTRLTGPGRILVAAAGNDGNVPVHASVTLGAKPLRLGLDKLPTRLRPGLVVVDLWSAPNMAACLGEASLEIWRGANLLAEAPLRPTTPELEPHLLYLPSAQSPFGAALLRVSEARDERQHLEILFDGGKQEPLPPGAHLAVRLTGQGRFDGWIMTDATTGPSPRFLKDALADTFVGGDSQASIVVPATARSIITVGSTTVQDSWESLVGRQYLLHETLGAPSSFSARGPTGAPHLTGPKPDLVAPGGVIVSAKAAHSLPHPYELLSSETLVMQGTSMAAPHVTGAVALMLEADATLQPSDVRRHLIRFARPPHNVQRESVTSYSRDLWGAGVLDVAAAVRATEAEAGGCNAGGANAHLALAGLATFVRKIRFRRRQRPAQHSLDNRVPGLTVAPRRAPRRG